MNNRQGPRKLPIVEMRAPEFEGEYEIRYVTGRKRFTLTSIPLVVTGVTAELKAPEEVIEGTVFEVEWEGPDNQADFVTIIEPDAREGKFGESFKYVKTRKGPRKDPVVALTAPEEVGTFEIRYVTGKEKLTLGTKEIKVVEATASIDAPEEAVAQEVIEVTWEGPGNPADKIAIMKPDAAEGEQKYFAYVRRGNELKLKAPLEPRSCVCFLGEFRLSDAFL